jgi:hypothetical protein
MLKKNDVVIIDLDRPREVRFGHKALKKLQAMGVDIEGGDDFNLDSLEEIMYCGLMSDAKENGEILKLEEMEDLLDLARPYSLVMEKMQQALNLAFGQMAGEEKNLQRVVENSKKTKKK